MEHKLFLTKTQKAFMRLSANSCGVGLTIISIIFSVRLLSSMGYSGTEILSYSALGVAFQVCSISSILYAVWFHSRGRTVPMVLAGLAYCFIITCSFIASVASFVGSQQSQQNVAGNSGDVLAMKQAQLADITEKYNAQDAMILAFRKKAWRTNAAHAQPRLEELGKLKAGLEYEIQELMATRPKNNIDMFQTIADFAGFESSEKAFFYLAIMLSLLTDICSALCFSYGILSQEPSAEDLEDEQNRELELLRGQSRQQEIDDIRNKINEGATFQNAVGQSQKPDLFAGFRQHQAQQPMTATAQAHQPQAQPMANNYSLDEIIEILEKRMIEQQPASQPQPATTQKKAGFVSEPIKSTGEKQPLYGTGTVQANDMVRYIQALFPIPERSNGSLIGRRKIADMLGMDQKTVDEIHARLKRDGVVEVVGSMTMPKMSQLEMLAKYQANKQ